MKALTIKQPWASLIIEGHKDIENRDWPTKLRGRVAIHSSAAFSKDEAYIAKVYSPAMDSYKSAQIVITPQSCPRGCILGTVEIVDCVSASDSRWFVGDYGFVLRNPVALPVPIPIKGALGFWEVPADVAAQIEKDGWG